MNDPQILGDLVIVIGIEADLVDVKRFGAVDIGDRHCHKLQFHFHAIKCSPQSREGRSANIRASGPYRGSVWRLLVVQALVMFILWVPIWVVLLERKGLRSPDVLERPRLSAARS